MKLGYLLFGASETLSKSLQGKDTTLQEALSSVRLARAFYTRQRTDDSFTRFYKDVVDTAADKNIGKPEFPRYRRAPARHDDGSQPHRFGTPEDYYRNLYFEACDLLIQELKDRFQVEEALSPVLSLENLLQAANGESYEDNLESIQSTCYREDMNLEELQKQLPLLVDLIHQALPKVSRVTSIRTNAAYPVCDNLNQILLRHYMVGLLSQKSLRGRKGKSYVTKALYIHSTLCSYTSDHNFKVRKFLLDQINNKFKGCHSPKRIKRW